MASIDRPNRYSIIINSLQRVCVRTQDGLSDVGVSKNITQPHMHQHPHGHSEKVA